MKTEIHLFLSSPKHCRDFRYKHIFLYIYMHDMVLQKTGLLWLSHVKLVLIFKAIHKQSFVFLLHTTPPFLALAHLLPTLLHTFIRAHSPSRRSFSPELQDYKTYLVIYRARKRWQLPFFSSARLSLLLDHVLLIHYCPECTGSSFSRWHTTIQTHHEIHLPIHCSFSPAIRLCLSNFLGRTYFIHF